MQSHFMVKVLHNANSKKKKEIGKICIPVRKLGSELCEFEQCDVFRNAPFTQYCASVYF
jgi:hypothetical protein